MNRKAVGILIVFLAISLVLSYKGAVIRINNEINNNVVVPIFDYYEFEDAAKKANLNIDVLIGRLKDNGVTTAAVKEIKPGFDKSVLDRLRRAGCNIVLRPNIEDVPDAGYVKYLQNCIETYGVHYLIFDEINKRNRDIYWDTLVEFFKKNKLVIGIIENRFQTGYVDSDKLQGLIESLDYRINRVYVVPDDDLAKINKDELFFRWLRGVVDRSIRVIYIRPLGLINLSSEDNISQTLSAVNGLSDFLAANEFVLNKALQYQSAEKPGGFHYAVLTISLLLVGTLYLKLLLNINPLKLVAVLIILSGVTLVVGIIFRYNLEQVLAAAASIIYPSLASLVFLIMLRLRYKDQLIFKLLLSLAIVVGINLVGGYTVITALADVRYTMGIITFSGVFASYIIPILLFILNYILCFIGYDKFKEYVTQTFKRRIEYTKLLIGILLILGLLLYIGRSGNDYGISATSLELSIRMFLEKYLIVRPRFKEFAIAYPALLMLLYICRKGAGEFWVLVLGTGVTMGGVSIVNSFCHVFTPSMVSGMRVLNGLVVGLPLAAVMLLVVHTTVGIYYKYKRKS